MMRRSFLSTMLKPTVFFVPAMHNDGVMGRRGTQRGERSGGRGRTCCEGLRLLLVLGLGLAISRHRPNPGRPLSLEQVVHNGRRVSPQHSDRPPSIRARLALRTWLASCQPGDCAEGQRHLDRGTCSSRVVSAMLLQSGTPPGPRRVD